MKYKSMKLKKDNETKTIEDKESPAYGVKVKQYLPIEDKVSIGLSAVEFAYSASLGLSIKPYLDAAFMVELIDKVSDIEFTKKQKSEILDLYDELESNGICDDIISCMNANDFDETVDFTKDLLSQMITKSNSVVSGAFNSVQQHNFVEEFVNKAMEKDVE